MKGRALEEVHPGSWAGMRSLRFSKFSERLLVWEQILVEELKPS